jgi:hypothetical protein
LGRGEQMGRVLERFEEAGEVVLREGRKIGEESL